MIKIRLTFLVAEKITADSQKGRVGPKWPGADYRSLTLASSCLAAGMPTPIAGRALSVTWAGNGTERAINNIR